MEAHRPYAGTWMRLPFGALNASGKGILVSLLRVPLSLGFFASFL